MTQVPSPLDGSIPPALQGLPLTLSVRVGTTRKSMRELIGLSEGALLTLDSKIDEPVEVCVDNRVIARGELVEREDGEGLAVKLTELVTKDPE